MCLIVLQTFPERCLHFFFMALGQLSADGKSAVASKCLFEFFQCLYKMMRRLINNHGAGFSCKFLKYCLMFLFILWQKSLKRKSSCRKSGHRKRCHTGCCTRQRCYLNAFLITNTHNIFSRIRNSRSTCICDQCNICT